MFSLCTSPTDEAPESVVTDVVTDEPAIPVTPEFVEAAECEFSLPVLMEKPQAKRLTWNGNCANIFISRGPIAGEYLRGEPVEMDLTPEEAECLPVGFDYA